MINFIGIFRHGLRIGEDSYSIKSVEHLYRPKRTTEVATAVESIVQYARWLESKQGRDWKSSTILKGIRDYNEDDCKSTAELLAWLRKVAGEHQIAAARSISVVAPSTSPALPPEVVARLDTAAELRKPYLIVIASAALTEKNQIDCNSLALCVNQSSGGTSELSPFNEGLPKPLDSMRLLETFYRRGKR